MSDWETELIDADLFDSTSTQSAAWRIATCQFRGSGYVGNAPALLRVRSFHSFIPFKEFKEYSRVFPEASPTPLAVPPLESPAHCLISFPCSYIKNLPGFIWENRFYPEILFCLYLIVEVERDRREWGWLTAEGWNQACAGVVRAQSFNHLTSNFSVSCSCACLISEQIMPSLLNCGLFHSSW